MLWLMAIALSLFVKLGDSDVCYLSPTKFKYAFVVSVRVKKTGTINCLGELVTEEFVVIPASCTTTIEMKKDLQGLDLYVIAGENSTCIQKRNGIVITSFSDRSYLRSEAKLVVEKFDHNSSVIPSVDRVREMLPNNFVKAENYLRQIFIRNVTCSMPLFDGDAIDTNVVHSQRIVPIDSELCQSYYCDEEKESSSLFVCPGKSWDSELHRCFAFANRSVTCDPFHSGAPVICGRRLLAIVAACDKKPGAPVLVTRVTREFLSIFRPASGGQSVTGLLQRLVEFCTAALTLFSKGCISIFK